MDELGAIAQYLPRVLLADPAGPSRWWRQRGTLLFSDVSGFTALSEKLARHGKAGAEEMVGAISSVFTPLLDEVARYDGDVLKFGGDALLTFFDGPGHEARAAATAHGLRRVLRTRGRVRTAFGEVPLGMSQGLHSDDFTFFVVGGDYADVIVTGGPVTATLALESAAERGEILMSVQSAAALPATCGSTGHDGGVLLVAAPPVPAPATQPARVATTAHRRFVPVALRDRLAAVVSDSEHRTVTVGFLQFRGCDATLAELGPDALHEDLGHLVDSVTAAAREHGVTIICVDAGADGGKFMLACGAPDAQERDAEMMLRFGHAVMRHRSRLRLRLGVNRGAAFAGRVGGPARWTYSTMGDPVNLAARVMGKASDSTTLATQPAIARAGSVVGADAVPPFAVKGKSAPVHAAVVRAVADRPARADAAHHPMVGRGSELTRLAGAWAAARQGGARIVEITGEAGSGKSRLVEEFLVTAGAPDVVRAAGERYHQGSAYFAVHLVIRAITGVSVDERPAEAGAALTGWVQHHAPELVDWLPLLAVAARAHVPTTAAVDALAPEFRSARLRAAVADLVRSAARRPTVFVLEDVFWFDDASVEVLLEVFRNAAERPWLFLLTRRDEPTGLHSGLGYDADAVGLAPLADRDAAELAHAAAADLLPAEVAAQLAAAGKGNPFFVMQIAQAWRPGTSVVPDDVQTVVAARLDRLPVSSRRLLARAAVLGSFVDLPLLEQIIGGPVEQPVLEPLLGEFLLPDTQRRVRFAHDLFRTVAYEALPFRQRRELHDKAGRALEARGDRGARAALLSMHFEVAGDFGRAWRYARMAADRARAAYATAEAAELYARALRTVARISTASPRDLRQIAEALGDTLELRGRYDEAVAAFGSARRTRPTPDVEVRLLRKVGSVRERQCRYREALSWYTRALRHVPLLPVADQQAARGALLVHVAAVRYRQGRWREAAERAGEAASVAARGGDEADLAHAYFLLDAALTDLQDPSAVDYRHLALPIYQRLNDLVGEANVHNNVGIDAYYEGRLTDALTSYERSLDCRRRAGDVVGAATAENNIGEVLSDLGRFDEAQPMFEEALAVWQRAPFPAGVGLASCNLARLCVRRGAPADAAPWLDAAEALFADMGADMFLFETRVWRAEMLRGIGDHDAARALAEQLLQAAQSLSLSPGVMSSLCFTAGMCRRLVGDHAGGRQLLERALDGYESAGLSWDAARVRAAMHDVTIPAQRTISLSETQAATAQHSHY